MRRISLTLALIVAAAGAPAAQAERTLSAVDTPFWPGKRIDVGGLGWGTAYGFCPAGSIRIVLEQGDQDWALAEVPATLVVPFTGGFTTSVRLPSRNLAPSGAVLRARQVERAYEFPAGCSSRSASTEVERRVAISRRPAGTPCTEENGCVPDPLPTLEVIEALPENASLPVPPPICPPTGCERRSLRARAAAERDVFRPGRLVPLHGEDFPDRGYDSACTGDATVRFYLTDASGTARLLPYPEAHATSSRGSFDALVRLPAEGLTAGPATLLAQLPSQASAAPPCNRVASATFRIEIPRPVLQYTGVIEPLATVELLGGWWATDRCDRSISLLVRSPQGKLRRLAFANPRAGGGFSTVLELPADVRAGSTLVGRQTSRREVADPRGRASKARCLRHRRFTATKYRIASEKPKAPPNPSPAPAPTPAPSPSPTPAPSPTPSPTATPAPAPLTLSASTSGPAQLDVSGGGWAPGTCGEKENLITLTLSHAGKPDELLGTVAPDLQGSFAQGFKTTASSGDVVTATQTACDGTPLSKQATVP